MTDAAGSPRQLAELLVSVETGGNSDPVLLAGALDSACRKLTARLAPVIGNRGVHMILDHALKVTRSRFPMVVADPFIGDGECLKGLRVSVEGQDPKMVSEALTALMANVVTLLLDLFGHDLAYVFLRDAWPETEIP